MTRNDPRTRAHAALAVIDRHHDDQVSPCPLFAYSQLAAALNELFGPLPDERLHAVRSQIEREVEP